MRVQVYWNFTRKLWSIRDKTSRRVIQRAPGLLLTDATYHVSEAGRQRVLRDQKKNVHAYIEGELDYVQTYVSDYDTAICGVRWKMGLYVRVKYNPYRDKFFNLQTWEGLREDVVPVCHPGYKVHFNHAGEVYAE